MKTSIKSTKAPTHFEVAQFAQEDPVQNINVLQIKTDQTPFISKCSFCNNKLCKNVQAKQTVANANYSKLFITDNTLEIQPNFVN